jgi:hypothetical protein
MCSLMTIFPPPFSDIMPHFLIDIVCELKYLGPVFLDQMYPFERFMIDLKKYVCQSNLPRVLHGPLVMAQNS